MSKHFIDKLPRTIYMKFWEQDSEDQKKRIKKQFKVKTRLK